MSDGSLSQQELLDERTRCIKEKQGIEAQLCEVSSQCKTRLPREKFQSLQIRRTELVKRKNDYECRIADCNQKLQTSRNEAVNETRPARDIVRELSNVRDKWSEIAADEAFHPPYRLAASQFVRDLNPILKKLCAP